MDGGWRAILEAVGIQHGTNGLSLVRAQRASGSRTNRRGHGRGSLDWAKSWTLPIEGRAGNAEHIAGGLEADRGGELTDGIHQGFCSGSGVTIGQPNSAATFF